MVRGLQTIAIALVACLGLLLGGGQAYGTPAIAGINSSLPLAAKVSAADLDKFAEAYRSIQGIRDRAEADMAQAVEAEKFTIDRFNAIADGIIDEKPETLSAKEQLQFDTALGRIMTIRQAAEADMSAAIDKAGLAVERFNEILEQSDQDEALYKRIGEAISGKA